MRQKLASSLENLVLLARYEGFSTAFSFVVHKVLSRLGLVTQQGSFESQYFDIKNGIDTSAIVDPNELDIPEDRQQSTPGHEPTAPHAFHHVISMLAVDCSKFQFIDFGSGAGRVLILASAYPWRAIRGVELSKALHDLAERNIQSHLTQTRSCEDILSICQDAVEFEIPDDDLVVYFFNPFEGSIFERVVANLAKIHAQNSRKVFIVYCHPTNGHLIEKSSSFDKIYDGFHGHNNWHIYESVK